jgi:superfamily I DNA/RNA helicase
VPDILKAKRNMLFAGYARYDDIRLWSYRILGKATLRAAEIIARRFPEILVDEAQDTTSLHRQILQIIEEAGSEICYIGDPRQAIFEFGDAEGEFLEALAESRECWELTMNFRSSDKIVGVIRSHFNDPKMQWQRTCRHDRRGCFAIVASPEDAVARFQKILADADIDASSAAVLVRTRDLRREVLGEAGLAALAPTVRRILLAWRREQNANYQLAAQDAAAFLLTVIDVDKEDRRDRQRWRAFAWRFLRNGLPAFGDLTFSDWIDALKMAVETFAGANGLTVRPKLGSVLRKSGLPAGKISDALSRPRVTVATDTIHGMKGKSISGVLVIGSDRHHRNWLDLDDHEMTRIGYVAFTRAENVLVLACPTEALAAEWENKGFERL